MNPNLLEKHFARDQAEVVLPTRLRQAVTFQELNLGGVAYPSPLTCTFAMDFILCRNVLIYLSAEAISAVARRMFDCLSPGGYLITGPSDPLLSQGGFEILNVPAGVAYRRPLAASEAARPSAPLGPAEVDHSSQVQRVSAPVVASPAPEHEPLLEREVLALRVRSNAAPATMVEAECRAALQRHPMATEIHYLHALSLLNSSQPVAAAAALRRAIYLDPSLAIVHFTLGSVLAGVGDVVGAQRAYRNAEHCAEARSADEPVPFAPEISACGLASAAARELSLLRTRSATR